MRHVIRWIVPIWCAIVGVQAAEAQKRTPLTPAEEHALQPKDSFRECDVCPEMVVVPAGSFTMGSPANEQAPVTMTIRAHAEFEVIRTFDNERPEHNVTIIRPFAVGKFEVTFDEWDACVTAGGCKRRPRDEGLGRGKRPVINASWSEITSEYLPWLSRAAGKTYRLLTEAEWEYAVRGGTTTSYWWGTEASHELANYGKTECCGGYKKGRDRWEYAAPVGEFPANPFGLHDMHGNVSEWGAGLLE